MHRYLVLGAGRQGTAAAWDLLEEGEVRLADGDPARLATSLETLGLPPERGVEVDLGDEEAVLALLEEADGAVFAADYSLNLSLTRLAIRARCHGVDYGGNHDVVHRQHELHDEAAEAGVCIVPDTGLTPGLAGILVADGVAALDEARSASIRVGGLPLDPQPPLNYALVFSVRGLTNEYLEESVVLSGGRRETRPSLTGLETLEMDGRTFEAFYTSGGVSTLPETFGGVLRELDCKTLRYPGHAEKIRCAFELGFRSEELVEEGEHRYVPREVFEQMLVRSLPHNPPDEVLMRITVEGEAEGEERRVVHEMVDRYDQSTGFTAMQRTTAWPGSRILSMALRGALGEGGVLYQERAVDPEVLMDELRQRGIEIRRQVVAS